MLFPTDNLIWVMPTEGLSVYGVTRMRFFILKGTNIMNITPRQMLLYAVSDRAWSRDDEEFIDQVVRAMKDYKGSGSPVCFMTEDLLTECLLLKDVNKRRIYKCEV